MSEELVYKTAVEFEQILLDDLNDSEGTRIIHRSMEPFIRAAKNRSIILPVKDVPSFGRALSDGNIVIPAVVEEHYSRFSLLIRLGEKGYLTAMSNVKSILGS